MNKRTLLTLLLAATAVALPSCRSTIGENIRNSAQVYLDADTSERYRLGDEVLVPEYAYQYSEPLITSEYYADLYTIENVRRTGFYRVLGADGQSLGERIPLDTPGIIKEDPTTVSVFHPMGPTKETRHESGYTWAAIAAAPFDYCIDPALSLLLTPPYMLLRVCGMEGLVDWVHY